MNPEYSDVPLYPSDKCPPAPLAVVVPFPDVATAAERLGMNPEDFAEGSTVLMCLWPQDETKDKNQDLTVSGYYEKLPDGTFLATVLNESEIFTDETVCRNFLFDRCKHL